MQALAVPADAVVGASTRVGSPATTSAWIAAGVALAVGLATVAANLWIARNQREASLRQPMLERNAITLQERDARIRAVVTAVETVLLRCWTVTATCRRDATGVGNVTTVEARGRLHRQTELLQAHAEEIHRSWAALRPDLSSSEHDRLLARRIGCMEALDALVTTIAAGRRTTPEDTVRVLQAVDVLDTSTRALCDDLLVLRRSWATSSQSESSI
jgi:hypothetical protein